MEILLPQRRKFDDCGDQLSVFQQTWRYNYKATASVFSLDIVAASQNKPSNRDRENTDPASTEPGPASTERDGVFSLLMVRLSGPEGLAIVIETGDRPFCWGRHHVRRKVLHVRHPKWSRDVPSRRSMSMTQTP